jgi:hypothetical protein
MAFHPPSCPIDTQYIWCWLDQQSEKLQRDKEEWKHSEYVTAQLIGRKLVLDRLSEFLSELEEESELNKVEFT